MEKTKKATIEEKAASAILQKPVEMVIGKKRYKVAPPSIATLIMVSEQVSRMPKIDDDPKTLVNECLSIAKDCRPLGDILAILILGAKHIKDDEKSQQRRGKWRFWGASRSCSSDKDKLAEEILYEMTPSKLQDSFVRLLQAMELGDFFGITTFLTGINLLHQTKVETKTEATVSGH